MLLSEERVCLNGAGTIRDALRDKSNDIYVVEYKVVPDDSSNDKFREILQNFKDRARGIKIYYIASNCLTFP